MIRNLGLTLALVLGASVLACAKTKGDEMQENLKTFREEQTSDKLFARGQGFASVGDWTRAEEYFAAALDAGGDARKIIPQLLLVCIRGQKYRVGIQYGANYLRVHPDDSSTRFIVATLHIAVEEYAAAKEDLGLVMKKEPQNAEAHFALGVAFRDGDNDAVNADKEFREYLRLLPKGKHAKEASTSLLREVQPAPPILHDVPPAPLSPATPALVRVDGGAP